MKIRETTNNSCFYTETYNTSRRIIRLKKKSSDSIKTVKKNQTTEFSTHSYVSIPASKRRMDWQFSRLNEKFVYAKNRTKFSDGEMSCVYQVILVQCYLVRIFRGNTAVLLNTVVLLNLIIQQRFVLFLIIDYKHSAEEDKTGVN